MNTKHKAVLIGTIAYIYIPVMIFLIGFVKTYFAVQVLIVLAYFLYHMIMNYQKDLDIKETVYIKWQVLLIVVILIASFCIVIGWGGFFPQAGDWYKHNAVLRDLSEKSWPVYYYKYEPSMLTYYIGQYLVPAVFGKITCSFRCTEIMMAIWGIIGVVLVFINFVRVLRANTVKKQIGALFIFLFFGGAVVLAQIVIKNCYPNMAFSQGDYHWIIIRDILLQYRSNFVMFRWVFPQCIVPWLLILMFMEHSKKIEYYVLLFLPSLLFATFSFISFLVYSILYIAYVLIKKENKTAVLLRCFSLSNILPAVSFGGILFFYFWGYVQVQKPDYIGFQLQNYGIEYIGAYVFFCLFTFGIYAICILKNNRKNPVFYFTILQLLLIPLFKMGLCNDFVMSVSIPALFALMIYVIQFLFDRQESEWIGIKKGIVIMCLLIGAWYPFCELKENIMAKQPGIMGTCAYESLDDFSSRTNQELSDDLKYNYYTYDLDDKIFYKYIARKKMGEN